MQIETVGTGTAANKLREVDRAFTRLVTARAALEASVVADALGFVTGAIAFAADQTPKFQLSNNPNGNVLVIFLFLGFCFSDGGCAGHGCAFAPIADSACSVTRDAKPFVQRDHSTTFVGDAPLDESNSSANFLELSVVLLPQ